MSTRSRILITALAIPLAFTLLSLLDFPVFSDHKLQLVPILVAILESISVAWVVNFRLRGERLFTVLLFPAISLGILIGFFNELVNSSGTQLDRVSVALISAVILFFVTYILTSNINILNLAVIENIPLGQAGRAAHYVLTLVFTYFFFVLLVTWDTNFLVKALVAFGFILIYTFVALWTISLEYRQRLISSLSIALIMLFVFMTLGIWPLGAFYMALFMVLVYYMTLGVALEIREIISRWIWYEYAALFAVIILLLLMTASWGVNGTIF